MFHIGQTVTYGAETATVFGIGVEDGTDVLILRTAGGIVKVRGSDLYNVGV